MSAFRAGAFDDAARQFHAFSTANAGDARAEDALYLRAIAYARLGRSGSARNAARDYLARNPSGFRAPEMRTLAE
jgi:TolA-binding protein